MITMTCGQLALPPPHLTPPPPWQQLHHTQHFLRPAHAGITRLTAHPQPWPSLCVPASVQPLGAEVPLWKWSSGELLTGILGSKEDMPWSTSAPQKHCSRSCHCYWLIRLTDLQAIGECHPQSI